MKTFLLSTKKKKKRNPKLHWKGNGNIKNENTICILVRKTVQQFVLGDQTGSCRLYNWPMLSHCVWTSKTSLFFLHWFTLWFCLLDFFVVGDVIAPRRPLRSVWLFSSCTLNQTHARPHPILSQAWRKLHAVSFTNLA